MKQIMIVRITRVVFNTHSVTVLVFASVVKDTVTKVVRVSIWKVSIYINLLELKRKRFNFWFRWCNTIFNAILSYIVGVGHNNLWKKTTHHPYVNDLLYKINQFYCHITKDSWWQNKQHTNNTTIVWIVVCSTKYNTVI